MIDRRQFIIGGACLASAATAEALRPRQRLTLLGSAKLETVTPKSFGGWTELPMGSVVQPREEGTLSAMLYSQILARVYENRSTGDAVMLSIAYGDTQSDLLQLHRPESCYPSFGFALSAFQRTSVDLPLATSLPTRSLVASAPGRIEHVTYWSRLGEFLPTSQSEQRLDKLRTALAGYIPDGMLVRCSTIGEDLKADFKVNRRFLQDLVIALSPEHRPAFVGTALSKAMAGAGS